MDLVTDISNNEFRCKYIILCQLFNRKFILYNLGSEIRELLKDMGLLTGEQNEGTSNKYRKR